MKIKTILTSVILSMCLTACGKDKEPEVITITENEVSENVINTDTKNIDDTFGEIELPETIDIQFNDNCVPGIQYNYSINTTDRRISYDIFYESSLIDDNPNDNYKLGEILVDDSIVWDELIKVLHTPILTEDTDNIFGYRYHNLVGILCSTLEDIVTYNENDILYSKSDMTDELWTSLHLNADTDNDEKITSFEDIMYSLNIVLDDMNKYN